jgi:predicted RNase H-like nuclease
VPRQLRAALGVDSHAAAAEVNRQRASEGVSAQVYGLRSKIFEVDVAARSAPIRG